MNHLNKSSVEVNKVLQTGDLEIFDTLIGNRPPNPQRIRKQCHSIKTNGILQNPIIVNEAFQVIDGQHRLLAAKEAGSSIYYIVVKGYALEQVQVLNLSQKNWTKKDFLQGYANMGIDSYVKLREFIDRNNEFNIRDCIALCSNNITASSSSLNQKFRKGEDKVRDIKEIFEEGTWKGKDFDLAQKNADKLKLIKPYYEGYARSSFVSAILGLLNNSDFDFFDFLRKLKIQPSKMEDCTSVVQYKILIEEIYNYKRREKVNLRF